MTDPHANNEIPRLLKVELKLSKVCSSFVTAETKETVEKDKASDS